MRQQVNRISSVSPWLTFNSAWVVLAAPTLLHAHRIARYRCYFFDSYLTCSSHPSRADYVLNGALFLAFLLLVSWSYFRLLENGVTLREALRHGWPALLAAFLMAPWGSFDSFYYLGIGDTLLHGGNPYIDGLHRTNPFASQLGDKSFPDVAYQPLWLAICAAMTWCAHGSILVGVYLFKLLGVLAHIVLAQLISHCAKQVGSQPGQPATAYFLNPLMMFEFIGNGHFDIVMMCFALAGFSLLLRVTSNSVRATGADDVTPAFLCVAIATGIKFTALPFAAPMLLYTWNILGRAGVGRMCSGVVALLLLVLLFYLPFWRGLPTFAGLQRHGTWLVNTPLASLYWLSGIIAKPEALQQWREPVRVTVVWLLPLIASVTAGILTWHRSAAWLRRRESMSPHDFFFVSAAFMLLLLVIAARSYWPWYLAAALPVALLTNQRGRIRRLTIWLTLSSLSYYFCYLLLGYMAMANVTFQIVLPTLLFWPAVLLLGRRRASGPPINVPGQQH
jgi:hypothetical protein